MRTAQSSTQRASTTAARNVRFTSEQRQTEKKPVSMGYKISEIFGCNTLSLRTMEEWLPRDVHKKLCETIRTGAKLEEDVANSIAHAMKEWAIEKGATHYCHWFQPMTGLTAEKHDSFLDLLDDGVAIERFSGRNLIQGEPDASSFPSGGLRTTFEARGYTGWDPSSPAFIMEGPSAATLCIPTVFTTHHGEAMDKKTPLLRSMRNLSASVNRLLTLFGRNPEGRALATIGAEQEYFLVDREYWKRRPDLVMCGRTLIGAAPAKGQQLEDHYFGSIRDRIQAYMQEVELELYKLGVPCKTRHNEVAPAQYESAPIFEDANIAADHNFLTMEVMKRTAERHGLALLLHEKPFAGINGSGKHCNWSIADARGNNMLDPGASPEENLLFLAFLAAAIEGVYLNSRLLRAAIATSGNDHRLGANEAPPAIVSVFLGESLSRILDAVESGAAKEATPQKILELGIAELPRILAYNTDRNRTSPFAFTGNKFEFRAVGASSPISTPVAYLNAVAADAIDLMVDRIKAGLKQGQELNAAVLAAIKTSLAISRPIRFEGNNYSQEWVREAEARGLPNLRSTPEALAALRQPEVIAFLEKTGILSKVEVEARYQTHIARFVHDLDIEFDVMLDMTRTLVLPAALRYQSELATSINNASAVTGEQGIQPQRALLEKLVANISWLLSATEGLETAWNEAKEQKGTPAVATAYANIVRPALEKLRTCCDLLETQIPDDTWPLPKYREMLYFI